MIATIFLALTLQAVPEAPELQEDDGAIIAQVETAAVETAMPNLEAPTEPEPIIIPRDTPVHLMVINEVSTKDHGVGHRFALRVNKPVIVGGREVIPVGATAWGELVEASESGNVGKRGKLSAKLTYIELGDRQVPIEGETTADGKSGKGETILGVLALGPLGLFAKGNNAKIKAGETMTGFTTEDVALDDAE